MKYLGNLWSALASYREERAALMPFVGREAIYHEKGLIMHVKIARIAFEGMVNRRRILRLELHGLRTHGLLFRQKITLGAPLRLMCACYPSKWIGSPYAAWTLYFSRKVIDDVKAIVLKVPSGKTFRDDREVRGALMSYIRKASSPVEERGLVPLIRIGVARAWESEIGSRPNAR